MRHLVRLICPPGGIVLDPFAGSGSTGVGCAAEGLRFFGIEQEEAYAEIARARLRHAYGNAGQPEPAKRELRAQPAAAPRASSAQLSFL